MLGRIAVSVVILWALMAFIYMVFGGSFVEACYRGKSIEVLNQIVAHHRALEPESHDLEFYQQKKTTIFIEVSLLFFLLESYLLLEARRPKLFEKLKDAIRNFFTSSGDPVNLAVFRIVFFGFFAWWFDLNRTVWFSQLPRQLAVPPIGFGWFLHKVGTLDPTIVNILGWTLRAACITAAIGFFARSSAFVVAVLGVFLCGIPQSYGKIDFYHFMIWFALLLSVSPCADMLSIDALLRAVKRADRGITAPPSPSRYYGLPLRLVWILMGVTYFFGGLWKLIDGRWNWIFGESLRYHCYTRWYALERIPRFGHFVINAPQWFFQIGALATIAFELSFIVLLLFPRSRTFIAAAGILFHNTLGLLMGNPFFHLQVCYVSFVDWHRIFRWFGQHCFKRPEYILFDGTCKRCRRTVSAVRVLDVLQRIIYVDTACRESQSNLSQSDHAVLLHRVHTLISDKTKREVFPCYSVAKRIPLLWLVYPFLFLASRPVFARRMFPAASPSKKYELLSSELVRTGNGNNVFGWGLTPHALICTGVTLIAITTAFGLFKLKGWPFTVGPTFNHIATPTIRSFSVERVNLSGDVTVFKRSGVFKWLSGERLDGIYNNIYRHPEKPELPMAFCGFLKKTVPGWADATLVKFYVERVSVVPTEQSKNPLERKLFFECKQ